MYYAFIDSNIFIRIVTQGRPGCEPIHLANLIDLVNAGTISLLVPEVVMLELEKHFRDLPTTIQDGCTRMKEAIDAELTKEFRKGLWNELAPLKDQLINNVESYKDQKLNDLVALKEEIVGFLNGDNVIHIPLTVDVMLEAERRRIAGRLPKSTRAGSQDGMIIVSLINFLEDNVSDVLFCSENVSDFGEEVGAKNKDRQWRLHPLIAGDFPSKTEFHIDLASMLAFGRGYEEAVVIEEDVGDRDFDFDDEAEYEEFLQLVNQQRRVLKERFESEVLPKMPSESQDIREELVAKISRLLKRCRQSKSWNDKSEDKLAQWLEYEPEDMIPVTSLWKLSKIKGNLIRYLHIHQKIDFEREHGLREHGEMEK